MSGPPSAEGDGPPRDRAVIVGADGRVVARAIISAPDDDAARAEARALAGGRTVDLGDGLRFIACDVPKAPSR